MGLNARTGLILMGLGLFTTNASAQRVLWSRFGEPDGGSIGTLVAPLGDVDFDGIAEVVVRVAGGNQGKIRVLSGSTGRLVWERDGDGWAGFGSSLATGFDWNSDGIEDIATGEETYQSNRGRVRILSGADGSVIWTRVWNRDGERAGDRFGSYVAHVGDLLQDGRPCLAITARGRELSRVGIVGEVTLYHPFYERIGSSYGERDGSGFGNGVAPVGDVDGDGFDDFLVMAPGYTLDPRSGPRGKAYLFSGRTQAPIWTMTSTTRSAFGSGFSGIPDANGDLLPDVALADWAFKGSGATSRGIVWILSGRSGAPIYEIPGLDENEALGVSVASTGDCNGDGRPDFCVAAANPALLPLQSQRSEFAKRPLLGGGRVYVFDVQDGSRVAWFDGPILQGEFGSSVVGLGDINGDGLADVVAGAPGSNSLTVPDGAVIAFSVKSRLYH